VYIFIVFLALSLVVHCLIEVAAELCGEGAGGVGVQTY